MSENVQVAVRVRPFNEREKIMDSVCCIRMVKETQQTIITDPETNTDKVFTFDYSYDSFAAPSEPEHASQQTVWDDIGIKVLEHAWNGFNVSLFAYGQTGSGKSFSMVGYGSDKGIIPRASEVIFERIDASTSGVTFKVEASMMEIYNERVKDLFNPSLDNLKVRDHPHQGPYAEGLTRSAVSSYREISHLMDAGILARTTASTNMNATSSRAHTIFQIIVTQSELNPTTNKIMDKVSRINLIDLAGSERAASTGATGTRLKEGAAINQSLSALGNCISALADLANGKKKVLVPYRNSKLTHLLKDSLGGNSKTIMIAALSPASINYSETLSTLRYADRAKQIKNQAIVNEDPNQLLIRQLKEELEQLRKAMMESTEGRPQSRGMGDSTDSEHSSSRTLDTEREKEVASIREQLEEHQRLLRESEKTWIERLNETEELARRREEQLKMMGLVSDTNDLKTKCTTEPHLLNLNEDQQMSEKLVYFLQIGTNKLGRIDAEEQQNIVIGGLGILKEHCHIICSKEANSDITSNPADDCETDNNPIVEQHKLSIRGMNGAKIFVNANLIGDGVALDLNHCDRLILGNSNVFRVVIPSARPPKTTADSLAKELSYDWQLAMRELNESQIKASLELEAIAAKEKEEMDLKVKKMEEMMRLEQQQAEENLMKQREEWEKQVQQLNEQMKNNEAEIKNQMQNEGDLDKQRLAEQLAHQEHKLAEELAKAEISFEKKQLELIQKQQELEISLQKQMREAALLSQQKERERIERIKFDDELLHTIPLVNEANSIAEELQKQSVFALKLIPCYPASTVLSSPFVEHLEDEEITICQGITSELKVQVTFQEAGTYRTVMWNIDQFHTNVYLMREMYQAFIENNRTPLDSVRWKEGPEGDVDPFYDPSQHQLIGTCFVFLRSLLFGCKIAETIPIFDYRGTNNGTLKCEISPTILSHEWQARQHRIIETCHEDPKQVELPTLEEFMGSNLRVNIFVERLRAIPGKLCKDVYLLMKWNEGSDQDKEEHSSEPTTTPSVDPLIEWNLVMERPITPELVAHLKNSPLTISVYGIVPSSNLSKVASRALNSNDGSSSPAEEEEASDSVVFYDVGQNGKNKVLSKKASMRRRAGKTTGNSDDSPELLKRYKQQLAMQERALSEYTQELEQRNQQVYEYQERLIRDAEEKELLRDSLEKLTRTNKLLQTKLEQQILKDGISKLVRERKNTAAGIPMTPVQQPLDNVLNNHDPASSRDANVLARSEEESEWLKKAVMGTNTPGQKVRDTPRVQEGTAILGSVISRRSSKNSVDIERIKQTDQTAIETQSFPHDTITPRTGDAAVASPQPNQLQSKTDNATTQGKPQKNGCILS